MKYDAFISYRHGALDGFVAEKLHKMLETYRIPRAIAKKAGKKKLSRIFRDREELPTSSNLSDSINEALESSAFLLLICSRRTQESQWVMREVERFGELRGKDKIITLLIDGAPEESFPPDLRERELNGETVFVEPLAADIRAATPRQSLKLLKEEKLRLLAPILGCAFDDLRRRHRRRRIQRIAAGVSAAFAFTLSFGAFSAWQYLQITRQMQLKLENQSYVLAEYAAGELADGDPDTAALLALAALPANPEKPERPLVLAAENALADALGVYDLRDGFKPHKTVTLPAAPSKVMLSPGESRAAAVAPFELTVFATESGQIQARRPTLRSALADAAFLSEDIILFTGENGLEAYDIAADKSLWHGAAASVVAVSDDGKRIAAVYGTDREAIVYGPEGGELRRISFGGRAMRVPADDSFLNPHDTVFALDAEGGRLAVSFADGSLSVFDTENGEETLVHPVSRATHFAGGFYKDWLAYAVVERDPYAAAYFIWDMRAGVQRAHFSSDTFHFIPYAAADGLYIAFEDQALSVDPASGEVKPLFSVGGAVETFGKRGDDFIVCESAGAYRFVSKDAVKIYASDYICRFADIGARFALTGSYDAKTVRILKKADFSAADLLRYEDGYEFSEAKIRTVSNRAVFYSYMGMRLCDLTGAVLAEAVFPDPMSVTDTQYDKPSGNIAVIYDDAFRLYSGIDASLILEKRGKSGSKSVLYTEFGVSVLDAEGAATLYDLATGQVSASMYAGPDAERALPVGGGLLTVREGRVFFDGRHIGAGDIIGAGGGGAFFAISDGAAGAVFSVEEGAFPEEIFSFPVTGRAEAYFTGGFVFVSPLHGDAAAYTMEGRHVRDFAENGYLAETSLLGDRVAASYTSSAFERYTLLLDAGSLETTAMLPGFLGVSDSAAPVLDDGAGRLRTTELRSLVELMDMARLRLDGRGLTPEETQRFKAG